MKHPKFIQICCDGEYIYGLDETGEVWFRYAEPKAHFYNNSRDWDKVKEETR